MKFSQVKAMRIPNGSARRIRHDGTALWTRLTRYVSFGDSIAAGHAINGDWEKNYGAGSQYGQNGRTETVLVPGCYTELINRDLINNLDGAANTTSFARSGDTVADLVTKLGHERVQKAIAKSDYATLCIGANDVLGPALDNLSDCILNKEWAELDSLVDNNLAILADDSNPNSYTALLEKLATINPNAKYAFMTIYNPYKYLYIEEGRDGFFAPLFDLIPSMKIDVDEMIEDQFLGGTNLSYYDITKLDWVSIELELDLKDLIIDGFFLATIITLFHTKINHIGSIAEGYVTRLNEVLTNKINAYKAVNPNFLLADAKAVFDTYPDRNGAGDVHYNDLVNVEFTRGFDSSMLDWGALWRGSSATEFWWNLATKHLYWKFPGLDNLSWDVRDYCDFDSEGFARDLLTQVIEKVFVSDLDPHPEEQGHIVLKQLFENTLGIEGN